LLDVLSWSVLDWGVLCIWGWGRFGYDGRYYSCCIVVRDVKSFKWNDLESVLEPNAGSIFESARQNGPFESVREPVLFVFYNIKYV